MEKIERIEKYLKDIIKTEQGYSTGDAEAAYRDCARETLAFIESLQEEPAGEGLEDEFSKYVDGIVENQQKQDCNPDADYLMGKEDLLNIARHFAGWKREMMMEKAVECNIEGTISGDGLARIKGSYKYGDKVKLVIIKEEE